jgi:hypothetical protein
VTFLKEKNISVPISTAILATMKRPVSNFQRIDNIALEKIVTNVFYFNQSINAFIHQE